MLAKYVSETPARHVSRNNAAQDRAHFKARDEAMLSMYDAQQYQEEFLMFKKLSRNPGQPALYACLTRRCMYFFLYAIRPGTVAKGFTICGEIKANCDKAHVRESYREKCLMIRGEPEPGVLCTDEVFFDVCQLKKLSDRSGRGSFSPASYGSILSILTP